MISIDRLYFIQEVACKVARRCKIDQYPIMMKDIITRNFYDKCILGCLPFSDQADVDAVTKYDKENDLFVITVNMNMIRKTLMKRLNFTLAHELGHIVLDHESYFRGSLDLTSKEKAYYEAEADEFAGNFLMPEDEIYFMPRDLKVISEYFFVSEKAVSKRIEKIKEKHAAANRKNSLWSNII